MLVAPQDTALPVESGRAGASRPPGWETDGPILVRSALSAGGGGLVVTEAASSGAVPVRAAVPVQRAPLVAAFVVDLRAGTPGVRARVAVVVAAPFVALNRAEVPLYRPVLFWEALGALVDDTEAS